QTMEISAALAAALSAEAPPPPGVGESDARSLSHSSTAGHANAHHPLGLGARVSLDGHPGPLPAQRPGSCHLPATCLPRACRVSAACRPLALPHRPRA